MALITEKLDSSEKPSAELLKELEEAKKKPVNCDDIPELSDENLKIVAELARKKREQNRKEILSIRVSKNTLEKAKKLGKGYTNVLSQVVEYVMNNEKVLQQCMM